MQDLLELPVYKLSEQKDIKEKEEENTQLEDKNTP